MKNYLKHHLIKLYQAEARKVAAEEDGEYEEKTVKVYLKYAKTAVACAPTGYDPTNEGLELKACIRQLSADERNAARALQDDSSLEVVINKRKIEPDMFMEFNGATYQIGAPDYFQFEGTEVKFRAKEVVPVIYDETEYKRWA